MLMRASGLRNRRKAAGPLAASSATAAIATGSFSAARRVAEGGRPGATQLPAAAAVQAPLPPLPPPPQRPVLDIWGGGMWFYWKAGALSFLQQQYGYDVLSRVQLHGSSSGAMVAVLAACGVDLQRAAEHTARVLQEQRVQDRCGRTTMIVVRAVQWDMHATMTLQEPAILLMHGMHVAATALGWPAP